ncbi:glutamate--cysteine ligase [Pistricoccus aurantiacus]|uniref:glutamate--cysteine ligase n=1 Tax=Pistricoccus aurantiacus TaxID=1883414 RepID=UPI003640E319
MFTLSEQLASVIARLKRPARQGRIGRLNRGVEKEGLRVERNGDIAQTPHPEALGSKLSHPHITTDYSEALLEFVTPVYSRPRDAMAFLEDVHRFSYRHLGGELIWPASMPCRLEGNDSVPIADYGSSNSGLMKHVYRKGLDVRYGRIMQAIAGIHYNVSVPDKLWALLEQLDREDGKTLPKDYRSARYFDLIRQFRRNSWLLLYLFGASPAIDKSFLEDRKVPEKLKPHGRETLLSRYATSLRMSDMGYQNKVQAQIKICFNSLSNYVNTLRNAIATPWPDYQALGVKEGQGNAREDWQQLNANILQIENEYYSDIRPKRVARHNETPSQALEARGVEYIEVRCLDLNPFLPVGIDDTQMRFLDTFMLWCLLSESPWISDEECDHLDDNRRRVVERGRDPGLELVIDGERQSMRERARTIFAELAQVAALLDEVEGEPLHARALESLAPRLEDPSLTPAGALMKRMESQEEEFVDAILALAREHRDRLGEAITDPAREALFDQLVETSLQEQRDIEEADVQGFAEFIEQYFAKAKR